LFAQSFDGDLLPQYSATSQLIWRDYFCAMSFGNRRFGQMAGNPACLQIAWNDADTASNRTLLECWKTGQTGYPFIDAGMRQLTRVSDDVGGGVAIYRYSETFSPPAGRMDSSRGTELRGVFPD